MSPALQVRLRGLILREMQRQQVTQAELARRVNIPPGNVSFCLSGARNIGLATLEKFAQALGCELHIALKRRRSHECRE